MSSIEIQRMSFKELDEKLDKERIQLAKQAKEKLGYAKFANAIAIPDALLYAMRQCEIEPLIERHVNRYKEFKARDGMWSGHKWGIGWLIAVPLTLLYTVLVGDKFVNWEHFTFLGASVVFVAVACIFSTIATLVCFFDSDMKGHRTKKRWIREGLSAYVGNVPEFALVKAVQIKEACPKAEFYVDYLAEGSEYHPIMRTPDPFLIVRLNQEQYYIDVWNEQEYEKSL